MKEVQLAFLGVLVFSVAMIAVVNIIERSSGRTRRRVKDELEIDVGAQKELAEQFKSEGHPSQRARLRRADEDKFDLGKLAFSEEDKGNGKRKLARNGPRIVGRRSTDVNPGVGDQRHRRHVTSHQLERKGQLTDAIQRRKSIESDVIVDARRPSVAGQKKRRLSRNNRLPVDETSE